MPMVYRQSAHVIRLQTTDWDLTDVEVELVIAQHFGQSPIVTRSTTAGNLVLVSVENVNGGVVSTLECTLSEAETEHWTSDMVYTVRANEGNGWQVVATGSLKVQNTVKRA